MSDSNRYRPAEQRIALIADYMATAHVLYRLGPDKPIEPCQTCNDTHFASFEVGGQRCCLDCILGFTAIHSNEELRTHLRGMKDEVTAYYRELIELANEREMRASELTAFNNVRRG